MQSENETERYRRHTIMPEINEEGQEKLRKARVLIVGLGGLGCPAAMYLASAGVNLGLIDNDKVDISNLQRQVLFNEEDIGKSKVEMAKKKINQMNKEVKVEIYNEVLNEGNKEIIKDYDAVVDCVDNIETKFLISESCVEYNKKHVYGSALKFEGQVCIFDNEISYKNIQAPVRNESCEEMGIMGFVAGVIGSLQAGEAIKIILGREEIGKLIYYNALNNTFSEMKIGRVKGEFKMQEEISVKELKKKIDDNEKFRLIDVREEYERDIGKIESSELVPPVKVEEKSKEWGKDEEIILYCRTGNRSGKAQEFLKSKGFRKARNVKGGIHAWSDEIDSSIPKY